MNNQYASALESLRASPKKWLVTGVAGFIGSNILEILLLNGQNVVGLDNFSTGHKRNLDDVQDLVGKLWSNFTFIDGDIRDLTICRMACMDVNFVLHQAALGSVPRSIHEPIATNSTNIDGFLNMLVAARDAKVESFVYAASSSTYGDHPGLPKIEDVIGRPLSPYAVTKYVNELYADVFSRNYGFESIGLRYFNVFGKRQDPNGAYAAVIPKWTAAMILNNVVRINGDGQTSRDFCYINNVVQANIMAAVADENAKNKVYNIAAGQGTDLNELFGFIKQTLASHGIIYNFEPEYQDFRVGDVRHSLADITKAKKFLGFDPAYSFRDGIIESIPWYLNNFSRQA